MKVILHKHVTISCKLNIGDRVTTDKWGKKLDGRIHIIKDIKPSFGKCESGFMVKIDGYDNWLDSNWLDLSINFS